MRGEDLPLPILPAVLALVLCAVIVHVRLAAGSDPWRESGLADPDSYVRLLRVLELWNGGGWYDPVLPWLGAPEGLPMHWTRLLDILIIVPAWPAMLVGADPEVALYWSAALICPALHILTSLVAVWAARALWPANWCWLAGLLILSNLAAVGYSGFGRADHHTLVLLSGVAGLGFAARAAGGDRRAATWAGVMFGVGVWVAPEALFVAAPVLAAFGLLWLVGAYHAPSTGRRIALGMATAIALALPVERPPIDLLTVEQDRISIQHLVVLLMIAAVFAAVERLPHGLTVLSRIVTGGLIAAVGVGALLLTWPDLLLGPAASIVGRFGAALVAGTSELQPLHLRTRDSIGEMSAFIGAILGAFAALAIALAAGWRSPGWRAAALVIALPAIFCTVAALSAKRFSLNLAGPTALAAAGLVPLAATLADRFGAAARLAALLLAAFFALLLPYAGIAAMQTPAAGLGASTGCNGMAIGRFLAQAGRLAPGPAPILMADDVNAGPVIAYVARLRTVVGPYHRLGAAFEDTQALFDGTDAAAVQALAQRRQVALLLVCEHAASLVGAWHPEGLRARLLSGDPPDWLAEQDLPAALRASGFRLYAVR
jgi:asparagine N-glycosylation enzyme membrane subunit Stt3